MTGAMICRMRRARLMSSCKHTWGSYSPPGHSKSEALSPKYGLGEPQGHMGDCQNYGPFLGPYYNTGPNTGPNLGDPKRDHNFDNPPYIREYELSKEMRLITLGGL